MKNKILLCVMAWSLAFSQVPCVTAMAEEESDVLMVSPSDENTEDTKAVMPNPVVGYKTLKQAEKKAGFTLQVASGIKSYKQADVSLIDGKLLQVNYKSSSKKKTILIRKAKGSDNISGDYNVYKSTTYVTINGAKVQFKGTAKTVTTATWTSGGFSYSVTTSKPISRSAMTKIVKKVK